MAASEEEAAGGDVAAVAAVAVTTLALTNTTQLMAGSMEWTAPNSGGVYPEKNLTRPGAMGACMFSTSAIVIMTPATYKRLSNAGMMMEGSNLLCHIPEKLMVTTTRGVMETPMSQKGTDQPRERAEGQGAGYAKVHTSQLRIFDCFL